MDLIYTKILVIKLVFKLAGNGTLVLASCDNLLRWRGGENRRVNRKGMV